MSQFRVYVTLEALTEIKDLPGNVRQRIREAIRELAQLPKHPRSKQLNQPNNSDDKGRLRGSYAQ